MLKCQVLNCSERLVLEDEMAAVDLWPVGSNFLQMWFNKGVVARKDVIRTILEVNLYKNI